ncbi:sugar phosphate isomerase/epimerase family protein [Saxibacter everestensis]|uniref:Sugar phosphate isomerase/epimerase family protein n=1 Tax=Saxibacter everestensis TaxID=2909229 RepID=A0ABY8QT63_9MICO|nr:sugar phosphate isomerase/epimerase family protein [Brevibacteriaceae bacterium ZFBP1038]
MTRFKYSYNAIVYYQEDIARGIERVAKFGYDAIELVGEPAQHDPGRIRSLTANNGVTVSSICSIWSGAERDLVHPDATNRQSAVDYGKAVVDFAAEVGASTVIVGPSPVGKVAALADPEQEWAWAVENVAAIGEHAAGVGVEITLEPWNRYETYFLNRLEQAVSLVEETGLANAGVHGDLFHMNIEELSIPQAFRRAGSLVNHVHLADSTRAAPGTGHIDFAAVLKALDEIGFSGHLTFELLPAASDPFAMMARGGHLEFLDPYTEQSIERLKDVEKELWPDA